MKLFKRTGKAEKNWRSRAMLIDLRKTKITITTSATGPFKPKHVPPWVYERQRLPNGLGTSDSEVFVQIFL